MSTTIGNANIQLSANAAGFAADMKNAQKRLEGFAQVGEKLGGAFSRVGQARSAFDELAAGADKLKGTVDLAVSSVGNLVNSMQLAKLTGGSMLSGLAMGFAGLGVGLGMSLLGRLFSGAPEVSMPAGSGTAFAGAAHMRSVRGEGSDPRLGMHSGGVSIAPGVSRLESIGTAGAEARRLRGSLFEARIAELWRDRMEESRGSSMLPEHRDVAEHRRVAEMEARRDRLRREGAGRGITASVFAAFSAEVDRAREALETTDAESLVRIMRRHRETFEATRVATMEARREADMTLGRGARDALRSPREVVRDELRALMDAEARTPGSVGADVMRRRADALARTLDVERPIGAAGLEAGSLEAVRAINAFMAPDRTDRGEELLGEVRDAIRAELAAVRAMHRELGALSGHASAIVVALAGP